MPGRGATRIDAVRILGLALVLFLHASGLLLLSLQIGESAWADKRPAPVVPGAETALQVEFIREAAAPPPPSEPRPPKPVPPKVERRAEPVAKAPKPIPAPPPQIRAVEAKVPAPPPAVETPAIDSTPAEVAPPPAPMTAPALRPVETEVAAAAEAPTRPLSRAERARAAREQNDFLRQLMAWLAQHRTYPDAAKKDKTQGTAVVRFSIDRQGRVLSASINRSSGSTVLDAAALEVLQRASPVPAMPASMGRDRLTISLPIEYALNTD